MGDPWPRVAVAWVGAVQLVLLVQKGETAALRQRGWRQAGRRRRSCYEVGSVCEGEAVCGWGVAVAVAGVGAPLSFTAAGRLQCCCPCKRLPQPLVLSL